MASALYRATMQGVALLAPSRSWLGFRSTPVVLRGPCVTNSDKEPVWGRLVREWFGAFGDRPSALAAVSVLSARSSL